MGDLFAGVDIGGTKTAIVLSSNPPSVLTRSSFLTRPEIGPEHALRSIAEGLREALSSLGKQRSDLRAIGVSCGGPLDRTAGKIQEPPNLSTWKDVEITSILAGTFQTKCYLENDANAGAIAEHLFGAGKGSRDMVFLTMGTGIGAGLILDGRLYRGASDLAGEIGHVRLTRTGPTGYGKQGSVEGWASGAGIAKVARTRVAEARDRGRATLLADYAEELTARHISEAAEGGDSLAREIIEVTGQRLGEAMAILIDLLNPERIVVGGLALRLGEALLGPARQVVADESLAVPGRVCQIVPAALGEEIGDVAALCVAIEGERISTGLSPT